MRDAVRGRHAVDDAGRRRDEVEVVFPLQPLLDDLHMKQPQKSATESESQRAGGFRFITQRGVVQLELLQRFLVASTCKNKSRHQPVFCLFPSADSSTRSVRYSYPFFCSQLSPFLIKTTPILPPPE